LRFAPQPPAQPSSVAAVWLASGAATRRNTFSFSIIQPLICSPFFIFPFSFLIDFTAPPVKLRVRHYRYFFAISQQKPGKRYFRGKKF
jgi:hypothetical protein